MKGARDWILHARLGPRAGSRGLFVAALLVAVGLVATWIGCSQETPSKPEASQTNVLVAHYQSPESFERGIITLDGERIDREWGSEFTPERGFTHVRVSASHGAGEPGPPTYVSMKAVYTDTDLYLLAQWADDRPDQLKSSFFFIGPDLTAPIIRCATVGGVTVCDSLYRRGPEDSLLTRRWWTQFGDDDKFAIAFEIESATGQTGRFQDIGCQIACHGGTSPGFGPLESGRLDLWYWLAGRTNPLRNIFDPYDPDKTDPAQGIPGYLDDFYVDAQGGLVPDEGTPGYWPNFDEGTGIPRHPYRHQDDGLFEPPDPTTCRNDWGAECLPNNGVPSAYLWRERYDAYFPPLGVRDTLNDAALPEPRKWHFGDLAPGYVLTYPSGSRADVRGKAGYNEDNSVWTLEIARRLDPERALGDDVVFEPQSGRAHYFTVAVFDASTRTHLGSEPQMLVFGPRNGR